MKALNSSSQQVGQTKDAGFQIGVRRTIDTTPQDAWALLTSLEGLQLWLGDVDPLRFEEGEMYQTSDGTTGRIRVVNPGGHLRVTWQPPTWPRPSTIQIRLIPNKSKTVISFHQEHLHSAKEREQMQERWQHVLNKLRQILE